MTHDEIIRLLHIKQAKQNQYSKLYRTETSSLPDEQIIAHDIATQKACAESVKADRDYSDALKEFSKENELS